MYSKNTALSTRKVRVGGMSEETSLKQEGKIGPTLVLTSNSLVRITWLLTARLLRKRRPTNKTAAKLIKCLSPI